MFDCPNSERAALPVVPHLPNMHHCEDIHKCWKAPIRSPLDLPFLRLNKPTALSLSASGMSSFPLTSLATLCWAHSGYSISVLTWVSVGAGNKTGPSNLDPVYQHLSKRWTIDFFNALAVLLLLQPGCCWPPLLQGCAAGSCSGS